MSIAGSQLPSRTTAGRSPRRWVARLFAYAALAAVLGGIYVVITTSGRTARAPASHRAAHKPRPYWIVRPGDTYAEIAAKTGVGVAQLEAYNPYADPEALTVGERLNLWQHPPAPKRSPPKPLGPLFWTVRPGQSFGSIAAATGIDITKLEQLNPKLSPARLQPGDRVRLRD